MREVRMQRGEITYEIQNLYGFSGDSGIQWDLVRFGGIHQDSAGFRDSAHKFSASGIDSDLY